MGMNISIKTLFITALVLLLVNSDKASQPKKLPLLYRITKTTSTDTSYLFGTLHLLESSYVDTMPGVMAALKRADVVVGEIVLDSTTLGDAMTEMMSGPPLDSLLSEKDYKLVSKNVQRIAHVPMMYLNRLSPIMIYALLLESLYQQAHPENHQTGIAMDLYFQQFAKEAGKQTMGLELASDQEALLKDSLPVDDQVEVLLDIVKDEKKTLKGLDKELNRYETGHIQQILDDPTTGAMSEAQREVLMYGRNRKWLTELPDILNHHNAFIAVGAGHLVGKEGLVEGLRKLGYTVTGQ